MNDRLAATTIPMRQKRAAGLSSGTEIRPTICSICNPGSHRGVDACVDTLIDPDDRDPISGFPAFKSRLCEVKKAPD